MIADPGSHWALMSSIIAELSNNLSECGQQWQETTNHRTLLPEPAINMGVSGVESNGEETELTFAMYPQES